MNVTGASLLLRAVLLQWSRNHIRFSVHLVVAQTTIRPTWKDSGKDEKPSNQNRAGSLLVAQAWHSQVVPNSLQPKKKKPTSQAQLIWIYADIWKFCIAELPSDFFSTLHRYWRVKINGALTFSKHPRSGSAPLNPTPPADILLAEARGGQEPSKQFPTTFSQLLLPLLNASGKVQMKREYLHKSTGKTKLLASMTAYE